MSPAGDGYRLTAPTSKALELGARMASAAIPLAYGKRFRGYSSKRARGFEGRLKSPLFATRRIHSPARTVGVADRLALAPDRPGLDATHSLFYMGFTPNRDSPRLPETRQNIS
jgi:hypothetical protein